MQFEFFEESWRDERELCVCVFVAEENCTEKQNSMNEWNDKTNMEIYRLHCVVSRETSVFFCCCSLFNVQKEHFMHFHSSQLSQAMASVTNNCMRIFCFRFLPSRFGVVAKRWELIVLPLFLFVSEIQCEWDRVIDEKSIAVVQWNAHTQNGILNESPKIVA